MLPIINSAFNNDDKTDQDELLKRRTDILDSIKFHRRNGGLLDVTILGVTQQKSPLWDGFAGGNKAIVNGYFSDYKLAADLILQLDEEVKPAGIYMLLNECNPGLLARANNRFKAGIGRTSASEVTRLTNLFFDFDPKRPTGISSTAAEHQLAHDAADKGISFLSRLGWPMPLKASSGNGAHLNYQIDLNNTAENVGLIKKSLQALAVNLALDGVDVDQSVFDPPRLVRLYGTYARKGDNTEDRPHRCSRIISIPEESQIVSLDLLKALADLAPPTEMQNPVSTVDNRVGFNVSAYLEAYGRRVLKVKKHGDATLYVLDRCVFNPDHIEGEAAIGQCADGRLFYWCFHNSCRGKSWHDAREIISGDDSLIQFQDSVKIGLPPKMHQSADSEPMVTREVGNPNRRTGIILPKPPLFPINVLPEKYREVVDRVARAFRVDHTIPGISLIAFAAACIGRRRCAEAKQGYEVYANLFPVLVGDSGTTKSPVIRTVYESIRMMEKRWDAQYRSELAAYMREKDKSAVMFPRRKQLICNDFTVEAVGRVLIDNPGGAMLFRDEIHGLFADSGRYSSSEDSFKTRLMEAYDSAPWRTNRIDTERNLYIPAATLSVYGSIQPSRLQEIFKKGDRDSGFLARFTFIREFEGSPPYWSKVSVDSETHAVLGELYEQLIGYKLGPDNSSVPIQMNQEASEAYISWHDAMAAEPWKNLSAGAYRSLFAKLRNQCLRVALILHCLNSTARGGSELDPITVDEMHKAIELTEFFKIHQQNMWQHLLMPGQIKELSPIQMRVATAILQLQDQVRNGMMPTSLITEKLNEGENSKYHISSRTVGKIAASLGFQNKHLSGEKIRGIVVRPQDIERFLPLLGYQSSDNQEE